MRNLIIALSLLILTACGGGSGGGAAGSSTPIVDSTPHDYTLLAMVGAADASGPFYYASITGSCDFSYPEVRDMATDLTLRTPSNVGGVGCTAAKNIDLFLTNTGALDIYYQVTIDGVPQGTLSLAPGSTINFKRGY